MCLLPRLHLITNFTSFPAAFHIVTSGCSSYTCRRRHCSGNKTRRPITLPRPPSSLSLLCVLTTARCLGGNQSRSPQHIRMYPRHRTRRDMWMCERKRRRMSSSARRCKCSIRPVTWQLRQIFGWNGVCSVEAELPPRHCHVWCTGSRAGGGRGRWWSCGSKRRQEGDQCGREFDAGRWVCGGYPVVYCEEEI